MDVVEIERDLTGFFAAELGMQLDVSIFRGGIPGGIDEGAALIIGAEIKDQVFRARTWNVQLLCKYIDRDSALRFCSRVNGFLPREFLQGSTRGLRLSARGSGAVYAAIDNGMQKWYASINMVAAVATSGPQI